MSDNVYEGFQQSKNNRQNHQQQRSDEEDEETDIENDQESPESQFIQLEDTNLIESSNDLKRKKFQNQNQNSTKRSNNNNSNNFNNNQTNIDEPETGPNNQDENNDDDAAQNDDQVDDDDDVRNVDLPQRKRFKKHLLNQENSGNSDKIGSSTNKQNNTSADNNNNSIKVIDNTNNNNSNKKKIKTNQNIETLNKEENDAQIFSDKMEARFLVSSRDAGAIIGRGGSNITHLRQTYDSSVTVPDCLSPERVLTIAASVDKVAKIVREILKFLETTIPSGSASSYAGTSSNYSLQRAPPSSATSTRYLGKGRKVSETRSLSGRDQNVAEIRLLLHTSHAGGLIGKGGSRITQLREETKAGIKIYSECCPQSTERVCAISGPIDIVTNAVALILNLLRTFPIKGPNHLYNPGNFDPYLAMHYGGFGETSASPQQPPHPSHGGGETNRNSIFTPPPIPPPPPAQYHHPTPPLHHHHHPHVHHHHHQNPFSSTGRLSALNGPPSAMLDARTPPEYTSPAAAAAAAAFMSQWPSAAGSGRMPPASAYARGPTPVAQAAAHSAGSDMFASGDDPFRWITDAKHYDSSRLDHSLTKRDDVSIIYNPNGTAIATVRVNNKIVGAIIGRGGIRIKEIRIKTQADISIEAGKNNDGGGSTTRSITVKGLYNDVQTAVAMICQCIDENRNI